MSKLPVGWQDDFPEEIMNNLQAIVSAIPMEHIDLRSVESTIGFSMPADPKLAVFEAVVRELEAVGGNAIVEVDAPEVPIMDGSALPFVNMLKDVGTKTQGKCKKLLVIKKDVSVSDGSGTAMLLPAQEFKITYGIDFQHPLIGQQLHEMTFSDIVYERDICAARTFGFLKDVEYLQAKGLALGGSLKNAVVLDEQRIINKDGLRCADEFVKHKILDAIGDLSLLGMPIIGHFIASKSGHKLNNILLKELMAHEECWTIVTHYEKGRNASDYLSLNIPSFKILDAVDNQVSGL
jgi:UDP-3-O-[3-hydroxymyristoyl] N-acetylglucosamine deacetylase